MSSGSFKDTARALKIAFSSSPTSPYARSLPADTQQTIKAFFAKHDPLEENDARRIHEELLSIYNAYVQKDSSKRSAFAHALTLLRPGFWGALRLEEWWKLAIRPTLEDLTATRDEVTYATEFSLFAVDHKQDTGWRAEESMFTIKSLLDVYLKRSKAHATIKAAATAEDEYVSHRVEDILIAAGKKRPNDLLSAIDDLVVDRNYRLKALELLCNFVRSQPAHLHRVSETSLIEHLLKCLMIDASTTALSFALSALIMFLPHIPSSARSHLPRLFLVYSRLLCWERFKPGQSSTSRDHNGEADVEMPGDHAENEHDDDSWAKLTSSYETTESTIPDLLYYFTFLYGLYPLNFTSYIRKPRRYLKSINFPRAEEFDLDQDLIRQRTNPYQNQHKLHRNFFQTTLEDELTDNQWLTMDPAEVMSECMGLCIVDNMSLTDRLASRSPIVPTQFSTSGAGFPSEQLLTEQIPAQLLAETGDIPADAWSQDVSQNMDSPGLNPAVSTAANRPATHRNSSVTSHHSVSDTPSVVGIPVAERVHLLRSPALRPAPQHEAALAYLQREMALLRNELNFERYLKQQHLTHIGVLQRRQIEESNRASDLQNLVNSNKNLKVRLAKAEEKLQVLKKEMQVSRTQAKKVEADLSTRVRALRESERQWRAEEQELRSHLDRAREDGEHLRHIVVEAESRELLSRQQAASTKLQLEQLDGLKRRAGELEEKCRDHESRELEFEKAIAERNQLQSDLLTANSVLRNQSMLAMGKQAYERRVQELESKLSAANALKDVHEVQKVVDRAVSSLQNKYALLKTEHLALRHRLAELEIHSNELAQDLAHSTAAYTGIGNLGLSLTASPVSADLVSSTTDLPSVQPSTAPTTELISPTLTLNRAAQTVPYTSRLNSAGAFSGPSEEAGESLRSVKPSSSTNGKPGDTDGKRDSSPRTLRKLRGIRGIM